MRNRTISQNTLFVVALALFSSSFLGCGDGHAGRVPVGGTVTVDGTQLVHGSVTFMPTGSEGKAGGGSIGADGRFQISSVNPNDGLIRGKYKVIISGIEPIDGSSQRWHTPKFYSQLDKSELVFDIKEANEDLKIELTWDKDPKHSKPFVERF